MGPVAATLLASLLALGGAAAVATTPVGQPAPAPVATSSAATGPRADEVLADAVETVAQRPDEATLDQRALAGAIAEMAGLSDLDALAPDNTVVALVTVVDGEVTTVTELQQIDDANARLLEEITDADAPIRDATALVLAPLTPDQLAAARSGDGSLDPAPWVTAIQGLVLDGMAQDSGKPAVDDPGTQRSVGPVVAAIVPLAPALIALVVVVGAVTVTRRARRGRAVEEVAHGTATVLEASRHMTGALDADEVRRIALRTSIDLVGASDGAWIDNLAGGPEWGTATPDAELREPTSAGGVVMRALRSGRAETGSVGDEPWLAGEQGEVTVVPVNDGGAVIGAVVVRLPDRRVPDAAHQALRSLAPVTGAAIAAATTHRGAVDASLEDALTGLPNRRSLDVDLASIGRSGVFSLAMVDVDHFKHFNDTNGHGAGDLALRLVGRALAGAVRGGDKVYRYGGEEFCIVLPRADESAIGAVAERLAAALRETVVPGGEHQPTGRLTASIGVAVRQPGQSPDEVLWAADAALYTAKRAGRDRFVVAAGV